MPGQDFDADRVRNAEPTVLGKVFRLLRHLRFEPNHLARGKALGEKLAGLAIDAFRLDPHHLGACHDPRHEIGEAAGIVDIAVQVFGDVAGIEDALFPRDRIENDLLPTLDAARVFAADFLVKHQPFEIGHTALSLRLTLDRLAHHTDMGSRLKVDAALRVGAAIDAVVVAVESQMPERALFLLDEAARLGYMRIIETARDAGRKYGITLLMLFQSLGQMREAFGGRDATSKWFKSASWVSFAAINDPETADYISRRCGITTVEVDQVSRSSRGDGQSRTRSKQLVQRPLVQPHEVMRMRADEQIIFTSGNPPLRCGRAIWFRRDEMKAIVGKNRFLRAELISTIK